MDGHGWRGMILRYGTRLLGIATLIPAKLIRLTLSDDAYTLSLSDITHRLFILQNITAACLTLSRITIWRFAKRATCYDEAEGRHDAINKQARCIWRNLTVDVFRWHSILIKRPCFDAAQWHMQIEYSRKSNKDPSDNTLTVFIGDITAAEPRTRNDESLTILVPCIIRIWLIRLSYWLSTSHVLSSPPHAWLRIDRRFQSSITEVVTSAIVPIITSYTMTTP